MSSYRLLLKNIKQLVRVSDNKEKYKIKSQMNEVMTLNSNYYFLNKLAIESNSSVIVDRDGKISAIIPSEKLPEYTNCTFDHQIDCSNKIVLPGLVDCHTHSVFSGDRVHEFVMKLQGKTYMEIHEAGGGIGFTVKNVRQSNENELIKGLEDRLKKMNQQGTTLVEVKSGYGLDTQSEIKMLRVIETASQKNKNFIDIVANYCGAHSIPQGMNQEQAKDIIINETLPEIIKLKQKGEINPEFIDVFCEKGVFERPATKEILLAGKAVGLRANFHGDELNFIDSGTLGAECNAIAISHLENLDSAGIKAMAENQVAGVLLPTTHYLLKLKNPPTREMIQEGVIVALGSDFNPNAYCYSMPFTMNLACVNYKMTPSEALVAATLNSAASINRSATHGSIEIGKVGDFVILDAPSWEYIIYQFGDNPIETVIKNGALIYQKQSQ